MNQTEISKTDHIVRKLWIVFFYIIMVLSLLVAGVGCIGIYAMLMTDAPYATFMFKSVVMLIWLGCFVTMLLAHRIRNHLVRAVVVAVAAFVMAFDGLLAFGPI